MSIETALLLIETVLLIFTITLLLLSLKEGRDRNSLIMQVGRATRTLTRTEYFFFVSDAISNAQEEIIGSITGNNLLIVISIELIHLQEL